PLHASFFEIEPAAGQGGRDDAGSRGNTVSAPRLPAAGWLQSELTACQGNEEADFEVADPVVVPFAPAPACERRPFDCQLAESQDLEMPGTAFHERATNQFLKNGSQRGVGDLVVLLLGRLNGLFGESEHTIAQPLQ